ncbi:uncharacterized protein LOC134537188 [Bacillus rossius redtenbacheri]|uniref:uncharacterized protein LOC134537188 n=1 Tax=Bacillus rossius redtenbacheri TaxID=93214 RepID=UPI002FDDC264
MKVQQVIAGCLLTWTVGHCFPGLDQDTVFTGRAMERAKEVDTTCRAESGAGDDSFHLFITGEEVPDSDHPFKCFVRCVMRQLESLDEDGNFSIEEELQNVPPEIKEEGDRIVKACAHIKSPDQCETAYRIHRCYHNESPEVYSVAIRHWEYRARN